MCSSWYLKKFFNVKCGSADRWQILFSKYISFLMPVYRQSLFVLFLEVNLFIVRVRVSKEPANIGVSDKMTQLLHDCDDLVMQVLR
jgi:hypothetical protein